MPYSLPDYSALQMFAQHLKRLYALKRRYNPLPYLQLRDQVKVIKTTYMTLSDQLHSSAVKMTEVLIPSNRLGQIQCIQQLIKDLSPEVAMPASVPLTAHQLQTVAPSHAIMLAAVLFRYLRLEKEYNQKAAPGAGFFERARALASVAVSMVVDRSPQANSALFNILKNIIFYPDHNILDHLTIKYCLEEYYNYIKQLPETKLANYPYIVTYPRGGKEKYLENIQEMIDEHQVGAQLIEKELIYIELIQSIEECLRRWDETLHACIKDEKKSSAITVDNLSDWLRTKIADPVLQYYLDQIILHRSFAKKAQSDGAIQALSELFQMNNHFTLFGAYNFIYQLAHQKLESQLAAASHAIFLDLFKTIGFCAIGDLTGEECDVYLKDAGYGYQALGQFLSLPDILKVFPKDIFCYWGGIDSLKKNISGSQRHLSDLAETDFVVVPFTV